ncbi:MAG: glycosyltransferase family 4 protein [Desertifilum sp.]|nr:glycosyltransferase family 4 protein [Desertifilum sp.]
MANNLLINLSVLMQRPTGISTYARNILPYLKSLSPTLLTAQPFEEYFCYPIPAYMTPEQGSKGHLKRLIWTQFQLAQIYQQQQAQLLFSPLPEAPLFSGCRYAVMVHDLIPLRFGQARSPMTYYCRYYLPQVLNQAQHILCNSLATARDISQFLDIPAKKLTPIPLGYDKANFRYLNLPESNYFLYVGRSAPYKNIQRLISAFSAIAKPHDYQLWLTGTHDPRYTPTLTAQVQELGLQEQVKFLDYVSYSELPKLMNQALALVFPSLWEGFGLPVLEAMACGTPIITSNLASLPEVAGEAALYINPYNSAEITSAMQQVGKDEKMRSHLRQASLTQASKFSWETTGNATHSVLSASLSAEC